MIDRPLYVDKIMAYVDTPFVKILTGVRRCGKSTILKITVRSQSAVMLLRHFTVWKALNFGLK